MYNFDPSNPYDYAIRNLIYQEEKYQRLLREYSFSHNPATLKEVNRLFNVLSSAWNAVRKNK